MNNFYSFFDSEGCNDCKSVVYISSPEIPIKMEHIQQQKPKLKDYHHWCGEIDSVSLFTSFFRINGKSFQDDEQLWEKTKNDHYRAHERFLLTFQSNQ